MSESYPFPTYSGLLEPEHYKKIGNALWLFLWCISSTTKEVEREGITWGIVLGNKPLKRKDLAEPFGVSERTVQRWLDDLEKYEYIKVTRAPYGYILTVKNSKKYKNRVDKSVQSEHKDDVDKSVHSDRDRTKMSSPEWTETSSHVDKSVHSNKDITKILNNTTTTVANKEADSIDLIADRFAELRTAQEGRVIYPSAKDYQVIAQIVAQGVPFSQTIELLERCFEEFEERDPKGKIKAFSYCKDYILEHYKALQVVDCIKKGAVKRGGDGKRTTRTTKESKTISITRERVGWIGRRA